MARRPSVAKIDPSKINGRAASAGEEVNSIQDPETLKTAKERECWKLFEKMATRGISVSYDTILRGMLTPTELRLIQKQREVEQAQLEAATAAANEANAASGSKKVPK